jgi:hypothetical protein
MHYRHHRSYCLMLLAIAVSGVTFLQIPASAKSAGGKSEKSDMKTGVNNITKKSISNTSNSITGPSDGTGAADYKGCHKGKTK